MTSKLSVKGETAIMVRGQLVHGSAKEHVLRLTERSQKVLSREMTRSNLHMRLPTLGAMRMEQKGKEFG